MAETDRDRVAEALRFLNVVCMGMVLSVLVYAAVAWFLTSEGGGISGPRLPGAMAWMGVLVAVGLLVAAPIVQRRAHQGTASGSRPEERQVAALEGYRLGTLLAFLLRDGAAIVGLMLTIVTGDAMWTYALGAAAVVAMFWGWPRREELDALFAREGLASA